MKQELQTLALGAMIGVGLIVTSGCTAVDDRPRHTGRIYGGATVAVQ